MEKLIKYSFNTGYVIKGLNPQITGEILENIANQYGKIDTENVIEVAKNESNHLHSYFEWNNDRAGDLYRKEQAGQLIRAVNVTIVENENTIECDRAFVNIKESQFKGYYAMSKVVNDIDLTDMLIKQAYNELQVYVNKYKHLNQLKSLIDNLNNYILEYSNE